MSVAAPGADRGPNSISTEPPRRGGHTLARLLFDAMRLPPSIILSSLVINLLGLALPLVILQVFDRVLRNQSLNTLTLLVAGLLCVILAEMILRLARNALLERTALREGFHLHMNALRRFLNAPRTATAQQPPEKIFDSLSAVDDVNGFFSGSGRLALLDFPFIGLFLGVIWLIGGWLAALPAGLIVLFVIWAIWSNRGFKRALEAHMQREHERFRFYAECLSGIATIKSLAIEPQMERRIERFLRDGAPANYGMALQANRMIAAGQLFASAVMISIVTAGGYLAIQEQLTLGAVAACTLIANRVTQPVLRIVGIWGQMEAARLGRDRASTVTSLPRLPESEPASGPVRLELREVAMTQPGSPVSSTGISLVFPAGSVTGVTCRHFAERAQFQDILRGQYTPDQGVVLIDDFDMASDEGAALAEQSYFLGGEPAILRGSILENIAMFRSGVAQIKAVSTARQLGVDPIIKSMPDGYETQLGDQNAAGLPRELLRGIDVVRAVAARPRLLIVRCLHGLDNDIGVTAARRGIEALRGSSTIVMLADHPEELSQADRIYALHNWRMRELTTAETFSAAFPGQLVTREG